MKLNLVFVITTFTFLIACTGDPKQKSTSTKTEEKEENLIDSNSFKSIDGIHYYEVKRRFRNHLSFNKDGFQQEPLWQIIPKAPDSILAYNPEINKMERFYLQYDHGAIFNFAREFFRVKALTKDSILMQRLHVEGRNIAGDDDYRSEVYSTYYSKDYIENTLKTTAEELRKPTRADTLFIAELAKKSNADPANPNLAFAARQPVVFLPNSKNVTAEKISTVDHLNKRFASVDYFYPNYKLVINKSYKDFNYSFSVIVDAKGILHVNRVDGVLKEDIPFRKKLLDGITSVYLQNLFIIKPGTTLGMKHSNEVSLKVVGIKNK